MFLLTNSNGDYQIRINMKQSHIHCYNNIRAENGKVENQKLFITHLWGTRIHKHTICIYIWN